MDSRRPRETTNRPASCVKQQASPFRLSRILCRSVSTLFAFPALTFRQDSKTFDAGKYMQKILHDKHLTSLLTTQCDMIAGIVGSRLFQVSLTPRRKVAG
jgi:hypothetical protein